MTLIFGNLIKAAPPLHYILSIFLFPFIFILILRSTYQYFRMKILFKSYPLDFWDHVSTF
ncbi:MAG: hypothetical protein EBZ05_06495 [Verrucomicrobia bacterium]|nr:hypothetical protein [Verrucomicrobiota bacterium]